SYATMLSAAAVKFKTVAALLADETMSYTPGEGLIEVGPGDIIEAQGFRYEVAASDAVDAHVETAGGVKLYVIARDGLCRTSQFGISPSTDNLGQAITDAIKVASEVSQGLVFDTPGEYVITGKVTTNGRISAENLNGFKLV